MFLEMIIILPMAPCIEITSILDLAKAHVKAWINFLSPNQSKKAAAKKLLQQKFTISCSRSQRKMVCL